MDAQEPITTLQREEPSILIGMGVNYKSHRCITSLDTRTIADLFRRAVENRRGITKGQYAWNFFTPEAVDDPFAALDGETVSPEFVVAAGYGLASAGKPVARNRQAMQNIVESGNEGALMLLVFADGESPKFELQHLGGRIKHVGKIVDVFLASIKEADQSARFKSDVIEVGL